MSTIGKGNRNSKRESPNIHAKRKRIKQETEWKAIRRRRRRKGCYVMLLYLWNGNRDRNYSTLNSGKQKKGLVFIDGMGMEMERKMSKGKGYIMQQNVGNCTLKM